MIHDGYRPTYRYLREDGEALRLAEEEVLVEVRNILDQSRPYRLSGEEIAERIFQRTGYIPAVWQIEGVLEILKEDG